MCRSGNSRNLLQKIHSLVFKPAQQLQVAFRAKKTGGHRAAIGRRIQDTHQPSSVQTPIGDVDDSSVSRVGRHRLFRQRFPNDSDIVIGDAASNVRAARGHGQRRDWRGSRLAQTNITSDIRGRRRISRKTICPARFRLLRLRFEF